MLTLIVADAELETVPDVMQNDPGIMKTAERRKKVATELLLDSNYMHTSIDKYFPGESTRRGRPDIIYLLLQMSMESILNKKGKLRLIIHTRNDFVIHISSEVRLPKSYNRFVGLIEKLFETGEISDGSNVLLNLERRNALDCIKTYGKGKLVVLSPDGKPASISEIFKEDGDYTAVIGGFSEGDFISGVYQLAESFSIFNEELTIWSVANELIAQYERVNALV